MKPTLSIENGYVTLELSPGQCAALAKACYLVSEQSCETELDLWRTFAALFHACTIAGYAQWHLPGPEFETLLEQLALLNLGRDKDDKSKLNGHNH